MNVGILETGRPPGDLAAQYGAYPAMFAELLGPGFTVTAYDVTAGEWPERADAHPAYIVTGSPAGVYEDHAWIEPLKAFLGAAKGRARLVGICFGHQIMAEAFGGSVEKSAHGWRVGLQSYEVVETASWMDPVDTFSIPASHQDQIVALPPFAHVLARGERGPFGLLAYDDQPAISFQAHPEFSPQFARALIEHRRDALPDPGGAIASLDVPDDRASIAVWIRRFLEGKAA
ncbi:MAG TPA: type 1 glutamine amidotransferase [Allosphingosinicella sp.]|jgi:GMP synthase-like glutamine amidotransferase